MRVRNSQGNLWNGTNMTAINTIAEDGLNVCIEVGDHDVFAELAFPVSGPQCRVDGFPGTILYYYEINCHRL
jgi:hypothetical protein